MFVKRVGPSLKPIFCSQVALSMTGGEAGLRFSCPLLMLVCSLSPQKHEKPKYVLCVAFTENGDTVTGDSGGNLYIWGKGQFGAVASGIAKWPICLRWEDVRVGA